MPVFGIIAANLNCRMIIEKFLAGVSFFLLTREAFEKFSSGFVALCEVTWRDCTYSLTLGQTAPYTHLNVDFDFLHSSFLMILFVMILQ